MGKKNRAQCEKYVRYIVSSFSHGISFLLRYHFVMKVLVQGMISHTLAIFVFPYLPARGLKTFTSKNDFWRGIQKPLAAMSSRCSSLLIVLFPVSVSPAIGCRTGSTLTSLHTCDNIFAVMSRMVLWRNVTKPPFLHDMDCSGSTRISVSYTHLTLPTTPYV